MMRKLKIMMASLLLICAVLVLGTCAFLNRMEFGRNPQGNHYEILKKSPRFIEGEFRNPVPTPLFTDDSTVFSVIVKSIFTPKERLVPDMAVPSVKTDLFSLDPEKDLVIWLGHSSYYVQLAGKRILVDPVFSPYASPFFLFNRAFDGTNVYRAEDIPAIDYLLITHDHWDHLDYPTVMALEPKVKKVVCGLGVGSHFANWGYAASKVLEADWFTGLKNHDGLDIHILPARHFSGRGVVRNRTLWVSFVLQSEKRRIFLSGDTGYGLHLTQIGKLFDGFDLAILENGQYDKRWAFIHMMPEETAKAAVELGAKSVLPAHSGKFAISNHAWDEPFTRLAKASRGKPYRLLTPVIGESVDLDDEKQTFSHWWEPHEPLSGEVCESSGLIEGRTENRSDLE